ncbi:HDIG domain-containing protein [Lacibacter luteus]|uniref:HDIG domain-containing protein n=1 Tax=Lacibacter luteus TaxID=2508719 RepID=A0A4V1M7D4_9BACT|nr:HDIG domain-containing metalloprotein [Lacibacter luteus]RXK59354.1 HDIG domain-containing protein [Lacibacter luteus]
MEKIRAMQIADEIIALYHKYGGNEYFGEAVTQLQHACQSAELAQQAGCDVEMILAAFLHDVGHICAAGHNVTVMENYGVMNHEKIGAAFLRNRKFSDRLIQLVQAHVSAKRYLTLKDHNYYNELSEASKQTLVYQGGKMSHDEALVFETDPLFAEMIQMRKIDEAAKDESKQPGTIDKYHAMIVQHLEQRSVATVYY